MFKDRRMLTVYALMLATFLTAVDSTIVDTAMPRIVGALGGFSLLTWVITGYLLTSTATIPVYGKLADIIGRKRTFMIGAVLFLAGSALCGISGSMVQLIIFRGIQGLGAGAIQPTVQTIIGDIFTPTERAKMQGWFSSVWGFSALVGPLVGGLMVDHLTWRWLFYINLPLGILALIMVGRYLEEHLEPKQVQVDYLGSITITAGLTCLLLALRTEGVSTASVVSLLAVAALSLGLFFWQERRAPEPMMPLWLFTQPIIGLSVLFSFMVGGVMFGTTVYLPIWAQGVQGFSATLSGMSLLWLSVGWPIASMVGGKFIMRMGSRPATLLGLGLNLVGALILTVLGRMFHTIPPVALAMVTFIIGAGMGFSQLAAVLAVQQSVEWNQRGIATALLSMQRTLGGLVWVSIMGSAMNVTLLNRLKSIAGIAVKTAAEAGQIGNKLLDPTEWHTLPAGQLDALREALAASLRNVHLLMVLAAVLSVLVAVFLPNMHFGGQAQEKKG